MLINSLDYYINLMVFTLCSKKNRPFIFKNVYYMDEIFKNNPVYATYTFIIENYKNIINKIKSRGDNMDHRRKGG